MKNVRELVEEARNLTTSLREECTRVHSDKIVRSVGKEWGKVRSLELADQVSAMEPMEQEEKELLDRLGSTWKRVMALREDHAVAVAVFNDKTRVVDEENKCISVLDQEAESVFFAFPRRSAAMRSDFHGLLCLIFMPMSQ